jgi:hypothetical protein
MPRHDIVERDFSRQAQVLDPIVGNLSTELDAGRSLSIKLKNSVSPKKIWRTLALLVENKPCVSATLWWTTEAKLSTQK